MKIDLSDCEEYKKYFSETYSDLSPDDCPFQFQVNGKGIVYRSETNEEYEISFSEGSPWWKTGEVALLKKLFPEAFL